MNIESEDFMMGSVFYIRSKENTKWNDISWECILVKKLFIIKKPRVSSSFFL